MGAKPVAPQIFPAEVVEHAMALHQRLALSFRDIQALLADRRVKVSHETVRLWLSQQRRMRAVAAVDLAGPWWATAVQVTLRGRVLYLWCARDEEGRVLDIYLQSRCNEGRAVRKLTRLVAQQVAIASAPDVESWEGASRYARHGRLSG